MKKYKQNGFMKVGLMTLIISAFMLLATNAVNSTPLKTTALDKSWKLDKSVNNVDFYYKIVQCNTGTVVLLAFNNRNEQAATINWIDVVKTQSGTVEGFRGKNTLELAPGESTIYNCNSDDKPNTDNVAIVNPFDVNPAMKSNISAYSFKVISVENK